jgi:hypothetical protein
MPRYPLYMNDTTASDGRKVEGCIRFEIDAHGNATDGYMIAPVGAFAGKPVTLAQERGGLYGLSSSFRNVSDYLGTLGARYGLGDPFCMVESDAVPEWSDYHTHTFVPFTLADGRTGIVDPKRYAAICGAVDFDAITCTGPSSPLCFWRNGRNGSPDGILTLVAMLAPCSLAHD